MTLQQLRYIIEIAKRGSINKAAQNLFVSQSSISSLIKKLEDELNITIFERTNHGIQLTVEGAEFVCYARQLVEQAEMVKSRYVKEDNDDVTRFSVSTQHYAFTVQAFLRFLSQVASSRYQFYFRETKTHDIIKDVYTKRSTLGVLFLSFSTEKFIKEIFASNDIEFNELKRIRPHVFIRKGHPLTLKSRVTVDDLLDYPYLSFEQGVDNSFDFAEEIVVINKPDKIIYVQDRATMNNIIAHTNSYNIGTGYLLPGIIDSQITSVPLHDHMDEMIIGWIKLKSTELTDEMVTFVDFLKDSLDTPFREIPANI